MNPKPQSAGLDIALKQLLQVAATIDSKAVKREMILRFIPRVHGFLNLCSISSLSFLEHKYVL